MKKHIKPILIAIALLAFILWPYRPGSALKDAINCFATYEWMADGGEYILQFERLRSRSQSGPYKGVCRIKAASALTDQAFGVSVHLRGHGGHTFSSPTPRDKDVIRTLRVDYHQNRWILGRDETELIHYSERDRETGELLSLCRVILRKVEDQEEAEQTGGAVTQEPARSAAP
jgi:hypothetical protein